MTAGEHSSCAWRPLTWHILQV